jgi:hypothetical protein
MKLWLPASPAQGGSGCGPSLRIRVPLAAIEDYAADTVAEAELADLRHKPEEAAA